MQYYQEQPPIVSYDDRRDLMIPGNAETTICFCAEQLIQLANSAIEKKSWFNVALSGGATPKALFRLLATPTFNKRIPWNKVRLFWSDERNTPPNTPESNYYMAMEAGLGSLSIPQANIHRMPADAIDLEKEAERYEALILQLVPDASFDLVMLGMGEDGHTASLFPKTHGLHVDERLVIANFIPQKDTWRMTLTFKCINAAQNISIYVIGKSKAPMVKQALSGVLDPDEYPVQNVGTRTHKALWILDIEAASDIAIPNGSS